ncbi:ABC transporter ATP-binding protein [Winogradskyella maritima]|uniref:ABC transporter ATP-binding protein n=1 Tax=Winogradskyella maritima TaxID=1517766 RepID=A0ABV8AF46_9FLAO|nr:ABC transporter ATP-binding protein [Winogradskyella maritima]
MLRVDNLHFSYGKTEILKSINFNLKARRHMSIIGESGSGKSTLLKLIYGELDANKGQVFWRDTEILGPSHNLVVGYDFMKYVTQEFDLMPFISVEDNIAKHLSRFYPEERLERAHELIKVVELEEFAQTKVKNLSGGQKQRVALARALAKQPEILLLDEPFSHIDNFKKQSLRRSIFNFLKSKNIACIVATHDRNDVLGFADEVLVLHNQTVLRQDTPQQLYQSPKHPKIAAFFEEFNVIDGEIYYAHQLKIVESSNMQGVVKGCYFNGRGWLVELDVNNEMRIVEHSDCLEINSLHYFSY